MAATLTIGFLGAGKMATALARGFVNAEIVFPREIIASDPYATAREHFAAQVGASVTTSNVEVAAFASVLILATKPDQVAAVLAEIHPHFTSHHLLVSIAAGVTLAKLQAGLPTGARVIRVMPNTPALIGAGASAYALGAHATAADGELAGRLLAAVGLALPVKEALLDAVTGLSGSGPAYFFLLMELLAKEASGRGIDEKQADILAVQTAVAAAELAKTASTRPEDLRRMVTSKGGTTEAALKVFEKANFAQIVHDAIHAAVLRGRELSQ